MWNVNNVSTVPRFNRALGILLDKLIVRAVSSEKMFAAAGDTYDGNFALYALVQCTRDLSPRDCESCLRFQDGESAKSLGAQRGVRILGGSCFIRYETYRFFNASAADGTDSTAFAPSPVPEHSRPRG